jgi:hypothetical protein
MYPRHASNSLCEGRCLHLHVVLFDPQDSLSSFNHFENGPTDGPFPPKCSFTLQGSKSRIVVETSCTIDTPGCTGHVSSFDGRDVYAIKDGKIASTSKTLQQTVDQYCD